MSFLTDLVEGHDSNLGNDITGMFRPNEIGQTLEGAGLVAGGLLTGGALLGGAGGLFGAGAGAGAAADAGAGVDIGGMFSSIFGNTAGASTDAAITAADPLSLVAPTDAASTFGSTPAGGAIQSALGYGGGASPAGFASTDAELFGGATGVPSAGVPGGGFAPTDAELSGGITGTDAAAPAAGATPAASPAGGGGFWNTLTNPSQWTLGGLGKAAGVAAAGAGLGMDLLNRDKTDPNQQMLSQQAAQLGRQGQVLMSYLQSGKLPPALQAQLSQAVAADKARIISGYAARGMSTDPNQNSALAQDLNNLQIQSVAAMADAQVQMLNSGLKETGMSTDIYNILTKLDIAQDQQLMQAISSFAAALGGGMGGGQNVKLSLA